MARYLENGNKASNEQHEPDFESDLQAAMQGKGKLMSEPIRFVSVIVLTRNEEVGLEQTLNKLVDFGEVIIVDSASEDATRAIAEARGARVVDFHWDGRYPKKKQWSLDHVGASSEWILLLDADEYPTPDLINEIRGLEKMLKRSDIAAFDIGLTYRFGGRFLRHGHRVTKRSLVHVKRVNFPEFDDLGAPGIREVEGHYQPIPTNPVGKLRGRLFHDDRDPVSSWFARHNRYSDWEAYLRMRSGLRREVASRRTLKGKVFDGVPFKPVLFFLYSYIARAGFLDGRAGLDYATALSTYYWQIEVKHRELKRGGASEG